MPAQLVKGLRDRALVEAMRALEANDGIGSWQEAVATVQELRDGHRGNPPLYVFDDLDQGDRS